MVIFIGLDGKSVSGTRILTEAQRAEIAQRADITRLPD